MRLQAAGNAMRFVAAKIDSNGRLHLVTDAGSEVLAPKLKWQTRFEQVAIAEDGRTVGWLADYPDPTVTYYKGATLAGKLVIFRHGQIVRAFDSEQIFWGWGFRSGGAQVAFCTGPTHSGASECLLRRVDSGAVIERWAVNDAETPPAWSQDLYY
jgi:hypothetical protein